MTLSSSSCYTEDSPRGVVDKIVPWKVVSSYKKNPKSPTVFYSDHLPRNSSHAPLSMLSVRKNLANHRRNMLRHALHEATTPLTCSNESNCATPIYGDERLPFSLPRVTLSPSVPCNDSRYQTIPFAPFMPIHTNSISKIRQESPKEISRTGKKLKTVTFSTMATVHTRPNVTNEDIQNAWYTDSDYSCFENERQSTVRTLHHVYKGDVEAMLDITSNRNEFCFIGLERTLTRKLALQRKYCTMQHNYAVLQQQFLNQQSGFYHDDVSIQRVSELYSKSSPADVAAQECYNFRHSIQMQQQQLSQYDKQQLFVRSGNHCSD